MLADAAARFWAKVEKSDAASCWYWVGGRFRTGYGCFRLEGRTVAAHRVAFALLNGPLSPEIEIDHVCHNENDACRGGWDCPHRACVNPNHLRLASRRENFAASHCTPQARAEAKTQCIHGHLFTPENTYRRPRGGGKRNCRACRAATQISRRAALAG